MRVRWEEREGAGMSVRAPAHSAAPKPAPASRLRHVLQMGRAARRRCLDTASPLDPDSSLLVAELALNPELVVGVSVVPFVAALSHDGSYILPETGHVTAFRVEVNVDIQTVHGHGVAGVDLESEYLSKQNARRAVIVLATVLAENLKEDVMRKIKETTDFVPDDNMCGFTFHRTSFPTRYNIEESDSSADFFPPYSGNWDKVYARNISTKRWDISLQRVPYDADELPPRHWSLPRESADIVAQNVLNRVDEERVRNIYDAGVLGRAAPYPETAGPLYSKDWWVNRNPLLYWKETPKKESSGSPLKYTVVLGARLGGFRDTEWLQRWLQQAD